MSTIEEKLNNIKTIKSELKTVANNYGGEITGDTLFADYSVVFDELLSSGGGAISTDGEYLVKVIDYDGTVLKEEWLNTGDTFTLPDTPTNNRLTFQTWSCPVEIVDNTITVGESDIIIGAIYTTTSGTTEIDIIVNENTGLTFTFQNCTGLTSIDWGDGTISTGSSGGATHTYASAGEYTIKASGITLLGNNPFGNASATPNYTIKAVYLANTITEVGNYAFAYSYSLEAVTFANSITKIGTFCFVTVFSLKAAILPTQITYINSNLINGAGVEYLVLPNSVTSFGSSTLSNSYSLKVFAFPQNISFIGNACLTGMYSLQRVTIPDKVTSIGNSFLKDSRKVGKIVLGKKVASINTDFLKGTTYCRIIDCSKCEQVPTLDGAITINNTSCQIVVPSTFYSDWIVATNWIDVANYIFVE